MYLHLLELLQGVVEPKSFLQFSSMISLVALHVATKLKGEEKERGGKRLREKGGWSSGSSSGFLLSASTSWRCL